ncbi:hypothetical protein [Celeribacter sp. ULVN23_4]
MPKPDWTAEELDACQKEVADWKGPKPQDPIQFSLKCLVVTVGIIGVQGFVAAMTGDLPPDGLATRSTSLTCIFVVLGSYMYQRRLEKKWWDAVDTCLRFKQE